ncbi:MAG: response regulator transcription factor [Candidatus Omnitrophica bacterium]|nr:response regulator transcription factor [Candidatus Omnitrophota bacterium]MDD5547208.1 response regulator transcription factor [Candidatus Omnitrophota bacterium]
MQKKEILIVEDDKNISKLIKFNLEKEGFDAFAVPNGEEALEHLKRFFPDLIILDIMLPKINGFDVCRSIKQDPKLKNIPVIMVTAKGEEVDRVVGLELGADDYIVKPFSPRELVLRVKAILKRGKPETTQKNIINAGDLVIDIEKHKVTVKKKEVELTPMEFKLLATLAERQGRVQSREQLLTDVWDIATDVDTRTIDTHIKRLREKLGKAGELLETVRGLGYRCREDDED